MKFKSELEPESELEPTSEQAFDPAVKPEVRSKVKFKVKLDLKPVFRLASKPFFKPVLKSFVRAVILLAFTSSSALFAAQKATLMTSDSTNRFYSAPKVANPAKYYQQRSMAFALAKSGNWQAAQDILKVLTQEFVDDGDTWFVLGHSYLQTGDWKSAIDALTNTIALGTILNDIEPLSSPANDIMIEIAKAHAKLNQPKHALKWIKKALDARWDDRKSLINHDDFKMLHNLEAYQQLSGEFQPDDLSRVAQWRYDLDFLFAEIMRLHVSPFHKSSEAALLTKRDEISELIPTLSDQQITYQFMSLIGLLGNSHNILVPTYAKKGSLDKLPITLYQFNDGVFIVDANEKYKHLVGQQITHLGDTSIDDALTRLNAINPRDNNMQALWLGPHFLTMTTLLNELNIINTHNEVKLALLHQGSQRASSITMAGEPFKFTEMPPLPANVNGEPPLYLKNRTDKFWHTKLENLNALYVQFNQVGNKKGLSLAEFSDSIIESVKHPAIKHLVLDLRHNNGGNGSLLPPLLRALINFETTHPDGKLFVIFGRKTFSAAHLLLAQISQFTNAVMVGEPSGSKPNHIGESGWFRLPFSGLMGVLSSQFHQASKAEDHRIWIPPHMPVSLASNDYFDRQDPALKAIEESIRAIMKETNDAQ